MLAAEEVSDWVLAAEVVSDYVPEFQWQHSAMAPVLHCAWEHCVGVLLECIQGLVLEVAMVAVLVNAPSSAETAVLYSAQKMALHSAWEVVLD